jgi:hypothetical protein
MLMRFDPTINLGHVLTFAGFIVAGFGAYSALDKRVVVLEEQRFAQAAVDRRQDDERSEMKRTNREDFKEINSKLDRLLLVAGAPQTQRMGR